MKNMNNCAYEKKKKAARSAKKGVDFSQALQVYYLYPQRGREYAEGFAQRPGMGCHGLKAPCAPRPPTEGHSGADAAALRYKRQERHGARPVQRRWHRAREIFRPSQGEASGRRFIFLPVFVAYSISALVLVPICRSLFITKISSVVSIFLLCISSSISSVFSVQTSSSPE